MPDLISRQAAIDAVNDITKWYYETYRETRPTAIAVIDVLAQLPTEQSEIIRCKDCKYYEIWQLKSDYTDDKRFKPSVCMLGCYAVHRPEDWYCADAERRTDG